MGPAPLKKENFLVFIFETRFEDGFLEQPHGSLCFGKNPIVEKWHTNKSAI